MTSAVVAPCTLKQAQALTVRIQTMQADLYDLVTEAHDRDAWKVLGYDSFGAYAEQELSIGRSQAYRLIDQARVIGAVSEAYQISGTAGISERAAQQLKAHLEVLRANVTAAVEAADPGEEPAAALRAVAETRAAVGPPAPKAAKDKESRNDGPARGTPLPGNAGVSPNPATAAPVPPPASPPDVAASSHVAEPEVARPEPAGTFDKMLADNVEEMAEQGLEPTLEVSASINAGPPPAIAAEPTPAFDRQAPLDARDVAANEPWADGIPAEIPIPPFEPTPRRPVALPAPPDQTVPRRQPAPAHSLTDCATAFILANPNELGVWAEATLTKATAAHGALGRALADLKGKKAPEGQWRQRGAKPGEHAASVQAAKSCCGHPRSKREAVGGYAVRCKACGTTKATGALLDADASP